MSEIFYFYCPIKTGLKTYTANFLIQFKFNVDFL